MADLTDDVQILQNAVMDYRDRVVPDIWAERNRYREALESIRDSRPISDEERTLWGAWCAEIARAALAGEPSSKQPSPGDDRKGPSDAPTQRAEHDTRKEPADE